MDFFDYITEELNDLESEQYRNVRWSPRFIWESVHIAMLEIRTDLVDVFTKDQEHVLARGTCYHTGFCEQDEDGNQIDGSLVKVLMIDNQSCKRPKLSTDKTEGIKDLLKETGGFFGYGLCKDECVGTSPEICLNEDGEEPYDWGGIVLDKGTNNFHTLNPTPDDRDIVALVRCSIIPSAADIEDWIINNKAQFDKVKHLLFELVLYYCYERDDEIQERDRMMTMRWRNYKDKLQLYNNKYSKVEYLWE